MKEILFRGKRKDNGEWVEGFYAVIGKRHVIIQREPEDYYSVDDNLKKSHGNEVVEADTETVCRYTGLTDWNGRKIFEGDIVRYTDEAIGKEKVDEVEYNETHAAFCRLHKSEMGLQYLFVDEAVTNRCEVIGNIYDNPGRKLDE